MYDITPYANANTVVRLRTSASLGLLEKLQVDNLQIEYNTQPAPTNYNIQMILADNTSGPVYTSANGLVGWLNTWQETGETDGLLGGVLQLVNNIVCVVQCLNIQSNGQSIDDLGFQRAVNLSGAATASPRGREANEMRVSKEPTRPRVSSGMRRCISVSHSGLSTPRPNMAQPNAAAVAGSGSRRAKAVRGRAWAAAPKATPNSGRLERAIKDDMIRYISEMSGYVACVRADHAAAVESAASDQSIALLAARNNAAVAELEAVRDLYVANVGPIEELLFEQSFDSGKRRSDAAPQLPSIPLGSDIVLQRAERIRGGACIENDAVSCKSITGVDTP